MPEENRASEVLDFWFGPEDDEDFGEFREAWFKKDEDFDREIQSRFSEVYAEAANGDLDDIWREDSKSCLALIIVLDQFPRNIFRGDPRSWSTDAKALETSKHAIGQGFDRELVPVQKSFVYMPFMHSENLEDQRRCVELFELMGEDGENNLEFAVSHMEIIEKFGRFPHRNEVLGRATTPEEAEFLERPGSSF